MIESTEHKQTDIPLSANNSVNQEKALRQSLSMEKVKTKIEEVHASILKDVDQKLSLLTEEVLDEIRKGTLVNNEFKVLFNDNAENINYNRWRKEGKKLPEKEFIPRNSLLIDLVEVKHIRTIYNIFIVILTMMFLNTFIHDFVDSGSFNFGLNPIVKGFGNVIPPTLIWLLMQAITMALQPIFNSWAYTRQKLPSPMRKLFDYSAVLSYVAYVIGFGYIFTKLIVQADTGVASRMAILLEMTRFLMKAHSFVRSNAGRAMMSATKSSSEDKPKFVLPTFKQYNYFLFAPTLLYRDNYPRTKCIRWNFVFKNFLEIAALIFYMSFIFERYVIPVFSDFGVAEITSGAFVLQIFGCMMPANLFCLGGFYLLLNSWLNGFAEMLRFADRMFYLDWWTATSFPDYYRTWNIVVHDWLYTYVYKDSYEHVFKGSKTLAMLSVFTVSSFVHEYIIAFGFGFFYPVMLFLFQGIGVIVMFITNKNKKKIGNIFVWFSCALGNGLLVALYNQEYHARLNCEVGTDFIDYFIPVSWSCNGITSK